MLKIGDTLIRLYDEWATAIEEAPSKRDREAYLKRLRKQLQWLLEDVEKQWVP